MFCALAGVLVVAPSPIQAEPVVEFERDPSNLATPEFRFNRLETPTRTPNRNRLKWSVLDGQPDGNSGGARVLSDGLLPDSADAPSDNFFFSAGTAGGRLLLDLTAVIPLREVRSYSWHPGTRGPQVYTLYASDGSSPKFDPRPNGTANLVLSGWKKIATVDTRSPGEDIGGQYAVRIYDKTGALGAYRFLLLDISATETRDSFGNTFYSEIQVIPAQGNSLPAASADACEKTVQTEAGEITLDTCDTPDLQQWAEQVLSPIIKEWYPKIGALLPGEGFVPARHVSIRFDPRMEGVAATGGTRINCAAGWFRNNLQGEAAGSVVHELVHVVQHYGGGSSTGERHPAPGWLVEGIADYIRWFLYEPQSHGADSVWIGRVGPASLRYNAGYRLTANFLDWVVRNYDRDIVRKLNAAARSQSYQKELWKEYTGHNLDELGGAWVRQVLSQRSNQAK